MSLLNWFSNLFAGNSLQFWWYLTRAAGLMGYFLIWLSTVWGLVVSSKIFNSIQMKKPFTGTPLSFKDYFRGSMKDHLVGIFGGMIWCVGMSLNILAAGKASPAVSYGLGQGATVVAAIWGIYVWKEFAKAPAGTKPLLNIMLLLYVGGLAMIILSK